MRFTQRMGRIVTAASFDMLARGKALEAQGRSVVHLGIGEPDFDTPKHIQDAATAAKKRGGKLRDAVANKMKRQMKRSTQRKSRVAPMSKSAGRSRGNAQTRKRKESRG